MPPSDDRRDSPALRQEGPQQDELIAFVRELRDAAARARLSRLDAASAWRDGTDDDHEAARQMAARQSGRPVARHNAYEREAIAAVQDRIAAKNANEVRLFNALLAALSASRTAQAPQQEQDKWFIEQLRLWWKRLDDSPKWFHAMVGAMLDDWESRPVPMPERTELAAAQARIQVLETSVDYLRYLVDHPVTNPLPAPAEGEALQRQEK